MEYDAVVYDLDGTLIRLDVDWDAVAQDVLEVYADAGIEPSTDDLWSLLELAPECGVETEVEETIAAHEQEGARSSTRLEFADDLQEGPVAVCSLNCEEACRTALEAHGLSERVSVIVGRDTVSTYKPDPEPLEAAVDELGVAPENVLFVGDSERDARTAERAGVAFEYVGQGPTQL